MLLSFLRQTTRIHVVFSMRSKKDRPTCRVSLFYTMDRYSVFGHDLDRYGWVVGSQGWELALRDCTDNYVLSSANASRRTRMLRKTESLRRIPTCHEFDTWINDTWYYLEAFLIHSLHRNNTHETFFCAWVTYRIDFYFNFYFDCVVLHIHILFTSKL